jgi:glycosyltransferase involved in cell wall biosynthesis
MTVSTPLRALFVGVTHAGWKTRQLNLERHVAADERVSARFVRVTGWDDGGRIERLPLPRRLRGRGRSLMQASAIVRRPHPDVTWTSANELLLPFLWSMAGPWARPTVIETDWSFAQQEAFATPYFGREPKRGPDRWLGRAKEWLPLKRVAGTIAWSNWAAKGLIDAGANPATVTVIPPGIDLDAWRTVSRHACDERPLRLLFVGGDFARKGGPLLLDVMTSVFAGRAELDIVTRDPVESRPGVRVHRAEANSPELKALYASADVFVMPTLADCFGIVTVEAMASGLPAIVSDVGGARDIVVEGESGWLVRPGDGPALTAAIEAALADRGRLCAMGCRARLIAEERFDGIKNDRRVVDVLLAAAGRGSPRR